MNKKLLIATGLAALLMITGCSKQPNLENATETQSAQTTQTTGEATTATTNENETVNTQNANVEEQTIGEGTKISVTADQKFAKDLANIVVYFDFDKYNIRPDQWPKVEKLAELIKNNPANYTVRIEGNCDEWGTEEYNYALGLKRANSVKNALIKLGVDPKKLTIISYGELNPVCTAHAKWCWRKNRRDNFTYLP
ncbi:lipoprotein [Nautilia profundicola AmH]|uniref:Peptidoglycan-associated lipoprotein n=1 Tax=Nautilia profundicola (strain ATCC BAA-1463 / DSM 18972 / AmH) TaxID=598659 RepID=B9L7Z3_NAUPA|nr:OmpA family protein [Nautilia profundicola]ACM92853.1 lipoprotein [Nautilia profundicola AmH]